MKCQHPDHVEGKTCEDRAVACNSRCVCCLGWKGVIDAYEARIKKGEVLSHEEERDYEFMVDKWDDWASDIEFSY